MTSTTPKTAPMIPDDIDAYIAATAAAADAMRDRTAEYRATANGEGDPEAFSFITLDEAKTLGPIYTAIKIEMHHQLFRLARYIATHPEFTAEPPTMGDESAPSDDFWTSVFAGCEMIASLADTARGVQKVYNSTPASEAVQEHRSGGKHGIPEEIAQMLAGLREAFGDDRVHVVDLTDSAKESDKTPEPEAVC